MQTPSYGELTAKTLVEEFKIRSPKDKDLLAKAKELAYKEGFYQGVMVIGPYKGEKVEVAKPKVKADLIKSGEAFVYNEPEGVVMSRSGDDCIVSLEDQWFTDYGEEKWKADAEKCLDNMNLYSPENRNAFQRFLTGSATGLFPEVTVLVPRFLGIPSILLNPFRTQPFTWPSRLLPISSKATLR